MVSQKQKAKKAIEAKKAHGHKISSNGIPILKSPSKSKLLRLQKGEISRIFKTKKITNPAPNTFVVQPEKPSGKFSLTQINKFQKTFKNGHLVLSVNGRIIKKGVGLKI